jgi:phosphatidylglycerol:prolipoprotein diacylglycerol transferase
MLVLLTNLPSTGMMLLPGVIRLGHTRVSLFGFFAAAGLITAISLSQRTARLAGVSAQKLWDAGIFLVFSAFVLSRVLLIAQDFPAFLRYPLIVLSLPSLTYGGMALTAIATLIYLRITALPLLGTLDAWSPCATLLAAVLALAHFVEGTDAGMPTRLPWGMPTPGDTMLGKVHPVQIYSMLVALALTAYLLRLLARPHAAGAVAATTFLYGGLASFLLGMITQPTETNGDAFLDPGQYVALTAAAVGAWLFSRQRAQPEESF